MFGFGGGPDYENPADSAMPYLEQVPSTVSPYYNPYIALGQGAARVSAPIYYKRAVNPQGAYNDIMSGYEMSPDTQYRMEQDLAAQQAAANSGGFAGTSYDQNQQAYTANGLIAQDQQRYYNNVYGMQNSGLDAGMNYFNTGYNASNTLAQMLGQNLAAEAGLAYQGTAFENQLEAQQRASRNSLFGTTIGAGLGYAGLGSQPSYSYSSNSSSPYIYGYSEHS